MKVLLISPNPETSPYPVYPLGLDYVAAAIEDRHQVWIADINQTGGIAGILEQIRIVDPDIIGISIRNIDNTDITAPRSYLNGYRKLLFSIKGITQAPVIVGGSGFSMFAQEIMHYLNADYGIAGEGHQLALLLEAIEKNGSVKGISGLITRSSKETVRKPYHCQLSENFCRSFLADRTHVDFYLRHGGMLNLQTKRGCCFKCIYCTYPKIEGRHLRLSEPEQVAREAKKLEAAGAAFLFITDSAFNADVKHSMAVAREFIKAGVSVPWGAYIAPGRLPESYFAVLAKAGMSHVEFGTDAFCDEILSLYQKPFKCADIFTAHKMAVDAGIHAAHFFLLGAPNESETSVVTTLKNAAALKKSACFFFTGIRIYPGTKIHLMAMEARQVSKDQNLLDPVFYKPRHISTEKIQEMVAQKAKGKINWIAGSGGDKSARIISRLHARKHTGPLWEHLVR
jgi:radical SAM superfamily enzyme YgiQ (UPF0313 family)